MAYMYGISWRVLFDEISSIPFRLHEYAVYTNYRSSQVTWDATMFLGKNTISQRHSKDCKLKVHANIWTNKSHDVIAKLYVTHCSWIKETRWNREQRAYGPNGLHPQKLLTLENYFSDELGPLFFPNPTTVEQITRFRIQALHHKKFHGLNKWNHQYH